MNGSGLQRFIDEFHATSAQQWLLRLVAVAATVGALLAAAAEAGRLWPAGLIVLPVLALASAVRSDNHTAFVVVAVVIAHWLATVDDTSSPWLPIGAVCLLAYHSVIALSASIPVGGVVPGPVLRRWLTAGALAACATAGTWLFVVILDGRDTPGNGLLVALALAIVAVSSIAIRSRSLSANR